MEFHRNHARTCPGCFNDFQNRKAKAQGVSGLMIDAHRMGLHHRSDRKLFKILPATFRLSGKPPPSCRLGLEMWPKLGQIVFEIHEKECKEVSPKVTEQTLKSRIVMRWMDQYLFRLAKAYADRNALQLDWKNLPDDLVERFAYFYSNSGL